MLKLLLQHVMLRALARTNGAKYEGEDAPTWHAYTIRDEKTGTPYLSRFLGPRIRLGPLDFRPVLHQFHRADADGALHNHPWRWGASLVLAGEYVEERLEAIFKTEHLTEKRRVRWFNFLTSADFHRVDSVSGDGEVWTLFVMGPECQEWGFLERGTFTPWREFLAGKRRAPHAVDRIPR